jgi:hypothetical protein
VNETDISQYIIETFEGVDRVEASGSQFFFYNPQELPPDHRFPFVTIVTSDDDYDSFSNLNRPSVFRLSMGIGKQTFTERFGKEQTYDFTALNQVMPHPVYGRMYWVFILNPGETTFEAEVKPLLAEAYELDVNKRNRKATRQ